MHSGSCLCGRIRYRITGPVDEVGHCHCRICQKAHGTAFATYARVSAKNFEITYGQSSLQSFESSAGTKRTFCRECGSQLQFIRDDASHIGIAIGTFDAELEVQPSYQIWTRSKAAWWNLQEGLRSHETQPGEGANSRERYVDAVTIRAYAQADLEALRTIYMAAIRELGGEHYSAEQIQAWAGFANDRAGFSSWLDDSRILVAVGNHDTPVGFGGLQPPSRISSLFVAPGVARSGVGSRLLEHLLSLDLSAASTRYTTEASELSKPLFEKFGFRVTKIEHTTVSEVAFIRYAMHKHA